jgi:cellulose biosynthesis protein BcsQ
MWVFCIEGLGKLLNTIKSIQKIHNADLDIEGLLTMFDSIATIESSCWRGTKAF